VRVGEDREPADALDVEGVHRDVKPANILIGAGDDGLGSLCLRKG